MPRLTLPRQFLRNCRRVGRRAKIADSTGAELTGRQLLLSTLAFRRLLIRQILAPDEKFVGLLLPPSAPAVVANIALPLAHRIPVNLNYTLASNQLNNCILQCGIRHILTSRRVIEKFKLDVQAELVYLEDFRERVTMADKLIAFVQSKLPIGVLERQLGIADISGDDLLAVLFTSGSESEPKGVMYSHDNIASQIESIDQAVNLAAQDVAIGVLPFFHSYGFTATLWTVLALEPKGVYHFDPRDAHQVGKLCAEHGVTVFMATPTFLRIYQKRVQPDQFRTLSAVFGAAERLPKDVSDAFESKFGVRPYEAYGCTELSPLVSVNVPPDRSRQQPSAREGTVGRPIPGVRAKIVDLDTGADLPPGQPGMLLVTGPNVMKGYLNRPDLTAKVMRDGWYVTGDIAKIDADGFIEITGRESRFSKIGGEMVPHIKIEETLQSILGNDHDHVKAVVTAVPDAFKGEQLVVLHVKIDKSPDELRRGLAEAGLPNLWIPAANSFFEVPEIPILGTGKVDLRALKQLAMERTRGPGSLTDSNTQTNRPRPTA
jgi:acyl-[acyl-carrier-protein]-phospholipid O-acyltransferase / long-chain-fatty-acid--[acyl-carrier-protein] ligase